MNLPLIPLRGAILFPDNRGQFDIGRESSINAVGYAKDGGKRVIFAVQKDDLEANPDIDGVQSVAVVAEILNVAATENNSLRVLVEGQKRVRIIGSAALSRDFLSADYEELEASPITDGVLADAYKREVIGCFEQYASFNKNLDGQAIAILRAEKNLDVITNRIAPFLSIRDAYPVLAEADPIKRLELLSDCLRYELEVFKVERVIKARVGKALEKSQKEHILREQMKVISEELDDGNDGGAKDKIAALNAPDDVKERLIKELARLKKISVMSPEYSVINEYIEYSTELPWNKYSEEIRDLSYAREVLDREHYGLKKVKERILEYIAVHNLTDNFKSPILCFIGPPGVGKTSVARSVANATGRRFVRMSLGGVSDEAEIRGHRKTYIAAMPGRIINGIKQAGTGNPVFLLDEIDKLSKSNKGDPASALLEVLDPEQNCAFRDNYLELPYDLSKVMFLTTANDADGIPAALYDRMEVIDMPSYTYNEKFHIAKNHLVQKTMTNNGLTEDDIEIQDDALYEVINRYTSEAGVRELERAISKIMRKTAYNKGVGGQKTVVTPQNLFEYLGKKTVVRKTKREKDEIGTVTGLAWTSGGGDILPIEINTVKGTGEIIMTGNLQDIIKESVKVALTYVHSIAAAHNIDERAFNELDYHIHLPETAVPKEGPSAGVGFASAIYSALTKKPVKRDVAMTGEISLRGNVTAVGGIKEKIMAGYRAGIETFLIPKDNMVDAAEIPDEIAQSINVFPISHFDDVIRLQF